MRLWNYQVLLLGFLSFMPHFIKYLKTFSVPRPLFDSPCFMTCKISQNHFHLYDFLFGDFYLNKQWLITFCGSRINWATVIFWEILFYCDRHRHENLSTWDFLSRAETVTTVWGGSCETTQEILWRWVSRVINECGHERCNIHQSVKRT